MRATLLLEHLNFDYIPLNFSEMLVKNCMNFNYEEIFLRKFYQKKIAM